MLIICYTPLNTVFYANVIHVLYYLFFCLMDMYLFAYNTTLVSYKLFQYIYLLHVLYIPTKSAQIQTCIV